LQLVPELVAGESRTVFEKKLDDVECLNYSDIYLQDFLPIFVILELVPQKIIDPLPFLAELESFVPIISRTGYLVQNRGGGLPVVISSGFSEGDFKTISCNFGLAE
jgi:hypothetical protein